MASAQPGHGGHVPIDDRRALVLSGLLTGAYFLIELGLGPWSGSVAVVSDAFHTFSAVGGILIALVAQRLSERPATPAHTFGWSRAEIIGALFNGLFLAIMAAYVPLDGRNALDGARAAVDDGDALCRRRRHRYRGGRVLLLYERQKGNLNIKGAFWHILQTFVGSLIIISAPVVRLTGFLAIDPLLRMVFGLVLFWVSLEHHPFGVAHPPAEHARRARHRRGGQNAGGHWGVEDVHHLHAWNLASGRNLLSGHLRVRSFAQDCERVLRAASDILKSRLASTSRRCR